MSRYHFEWDLRELGDKARNLPAPAKPLRGPRDRDRLAFARALALGEIPADAPPTGTDSGAAGYGSRVRGLT